MRCILSVAIAIAVANTAIATEPRTNQSAKGTIAPAVPKNMQRILTRLAERDRATTNDVATLLVGPQPDFARFMLNRLPEQERRTGVREDVFVGAKLVQGPPQGNADQITEIAIRPARLIASRLERYAPAIPLVERIEAKVERKLEFRREVIRSLTLLTSPQPQIFKYLAAQSASVDLRRVREGMHRFWMNNQPSVLTYERLNGAIGP